MFFIYIKHFIFFYLLMIYRLDRFILKKIVKNLFFLFLGKIILKIKFLFLTNFSNLYFQTYLVKVKFDYKVDNQKFGNLNH